MDGNLDGSPLAGPDIDFSNESFWNASPDDWTVKPTWEVAVKLGVLFTIVLIGILGNLSVIVIILRNKLLLLQPTNLFLLNMCISDFLNLLVNPILFIFKEKVIFRFYYLGDFFCNVTALMIVTIMLTSVFSLTIISINRFFGICYPNITTLTRSRLRVCLIISLIWIVAMAAALPTVKFKMYFERDWSDVKERSCTQDKSAEDFSQIYWLALLFLLVWLPTLIMIFCYSAIFYKLRQSAIQFSFMSEQSKIARSRQQVTRNLVVMLIIQIVCWCPWQLFTLYESFRKTPSIEQGDTEFLNYYNSVVSPILHDVKFYFVFAGSAINPIVYGYGNKTMKIAFKLTFPFFFSEKPNYVLTRKGGGKLGFAKPVDNLSKKHAKVPKTLFQIGLCALHPIWSHSERLDYSGRQPFKPMTLMTKIAKKLGKTANEIGSVQLRRRNLRTRSNSEGNIVFPRTEINGNFRVFIDPATPDVRQRRQRGQGHGQGQGHGLGLSPGPPGKRSGLLGLADVLKRRLSNQSLEPNPNNFSVSSSASFSSERSISVDIHIDVRLNTPSSSSSRRPSRVGEQQQQQRPARTPASEFAAKPKIHLTHLRVNEDSSEAARRRYTK